MTRFDVTFRDYVAPTGWTLSRALEVLDVSTEKFNYQDNFGADGYSYLRVLSIRPEPKVWTVPIIAAHELAHIVLGHTAYVANVEDLGLDRSEIPFARFELEAHMVAKVVGYGLELTDDEFKKELVQRYIDAARGHVGDEVNAKTAIRLAGAALKILDAGRVRAEVDLFGEVIG